LIRINRNYYLSLGFIHHQPHQIMRSNYKERREAKAERAAELAAKAEKESQARHKEADRQSGAFYMGQPILKGHHSEGPARRLQAKMHNNVRKGIEASERANYWQERADRFEREPYAISSDDPEALVKLQERLESFQWKQGQMKEVNTAYRAWKKKGDAALEQFPDLSTKMVQLITTWQPQYSWEKAPFLSHDLSSINTKIKGVQERIDRIQALNNRPDREYQINEIKIAENATENRVQMFFDGKPSDDTITRLKRYGFKYAGSLGCWQRQYSDAAIYYAKDIAESHNQ